MEDVQLRLIRSQRVECYVYAAIFGGCAAFAAVVCAATGLWVELGIFSAVLTLPGLVFCANTVLGWTRLGPDGIRTWRPLWRRRAAWADVAEITEAGWHGRSSASWSRVVVRRTDGGSFTLAAPLSATGTAGSANFADPEFAEKVARIKEYWRAAPHPDCR